MSSELNASIRLNLTGDLAEKSRIYQREMRSMERQTRLSFQVMNKVSQKAMSGINTALDGMTSQYAMFAASLAGGVSFKNAISLERRLNRIGVQAEISAEQVKKLQDEIYTTAMDKDISLDPSELISAIEEIVTRTGDLEYARRNIEALGQTIQATGAMGADIGGLVAELQKLEVDDVSRGMNILVAQGKAGSVEAKDLAKLGPRILSAYAGTTKRTGEVALAELGASMQVLQAATGNPEIAATTLEALLRDLQTPDKMRKLSMMGIELNEVDDEGRTVMRDLPSIMTDIVTTLDGNMARIGTIFGDEARRGFNNITAELIRNEQIESFDKFSNLDINFNQIAEDSKRIASDSAGGLQRLSNSWNYFINNQLSGPLTHLADVLRNVSTETMQSIYHIGKWIALVTGVGLVLRNTGAIKGALWLYKAYKNRGKNGGGLSDAQGMGSLSVQPVYVVNMPGSGFGGMGGHASRTRQGTSRLGNNPLLLGGPAAIDADFEPVDKTRRNSKWRNSRWGRMGSQLVGAGGGRLLGVAGSGIMLADIAMNGGGATEVGEAAGSGLGGLAGAKLGAVIGSVVPGIGTAIGSVIGGLLGSVAGSYAGGAAGEYIERPSAPNELQGEVKVSIEDNRIRTKEVTSNTPGVNFSAFAGPDLGYYGG